MKLGHVISDSSRLRHGRAVGQVDGSGKGACGREWTLRAGTTVNQRLSAEGRMLLGVWTEGPVNPRPYEIGRNEIASIRCLTTCLHWEGDPPFQKAFS